MYRQTANGGVASPCSSLSPWRHVTAAGTVSACGLFLAGSTRRPASSSAADRPAEDDGRHAHLHRWLASDLYGHTPVVRIATWNLNVKMRPGALDLFDKLDADVLLLTEAPADLDPDGYVRTPPGPQMLRGQEWATI